MKRVVKIMGIAALCALTLGACKKDKIDYAEVEGNGTENVGYLSFADFEATVMEDTENVTSSPKTRAESVDVNTFDVTVTNQAGEVMTSFKYGEKPAEPIALDAGVYKVALSSGTMEGAAWDTPIYGTEKEFTIKRKETTSVSDIVCKLMNIKVTVSYSADLADQLDADNTKMTVELEDSALEYAYGEARAGYFAPVAAENTLKLTFNCRYAGETKDITMTSEIKGVKAAQWRKINVAVPHASDGSASFVITCDTWTYDDEVTFDTSTMLMEVAIPDDTDAPVINWEGHDLTEPFELTDDMFDAEGNFTSSINLDVTAKSALKSLVVKVASDNADFTAAYSEIMSLEEDLCAPTASAAILKMMGYPTDAKDATSTRLKFASQVDLLKSYEGAHSYEITATDETGASATATLVIHYGKVVGPKVVWNSDVYKLDTRYTIVPDMTCEIIVTSSTGITEFIVDISSEALEPLLGDAGIPSRFSLVNDEEIFDTLKGLGFPTGDEVKGAKERTLDISTFLPVLMGVEGNHDFKMEVTDESGTTIKTIMLAGAGA